MRGFVAGTTASARTWWKTMGKVNKVSGSKKNKIGQTNKTLQIQGSWAEFSLDRGRNDVLPFLHTKNMMKGTSSPLRSAFRELPVGARQQASDLAKSSWSSLLKENSLIGSAGRTRYRAGPVGAC